MIDLIITDPPFAIDFKEEKGNYNRTASNVLKGYVEVDKKDYLDFSKRWISEAYRVLKESGSLFIFSGWNNLKDILIAVDEIGFITVNHIIWKYQFGVYCSKKFVTSHYHCLYLCKDDKKRKFYKDRRYGPKEKTMNGSSLQYKDMEDVWVINREYWKGKEKTPTKLPTELVLKILTYTSDELDLVLDPFSGSGQVPLVCYLKNRRYIGFEISEEYVSFSEKRIESRRGDFFIDKRLVDLY
ncbi:MAG TPA: site-specific DNA-methyltransferase [Bacilli bacterium]|nr:site-specific DNA-methyltransferase [Bacilli bacterium]